jgi:hypothetical protein
MASRLQNHLDLADMTQPLNFCVNPEIFNRRFFFTGSERLSRTNATGDRLKEAQNINKSLSSLGDVIAAAAAKQGHIPYRNSKLTHVLQVQKPRTLKHH